MSSLLSIIFLAAIIIWALKPKNQEEPDEKYISNDDSDYEFWCNYIMLCAIHDTAQQIADEEERKEREEEERRERRRRLKDKDND